MCNLSDEIKRNFFQVVIVSILLYGGTSWTLTKRIDKKLHGKYSRMLALSLTNPVGNLPNNNSCLATYFSSHKQLMQNEKTSWALLENHRRTHKRCHHMDSCTLTSQWWLTNKNLFTSASCGHKMQFERPAGSDGW